MHSISSSRPWVLNVPSQFAWFGAAHHAITPQRLLGLALMTIGVFLSVRR